MRAAWSPFFSCRAAWALAVFLLLAAVGCAGSGAAEKPPDARYGHRYPTGGASDGERTLSITPPDSADSYFYYAAPVGKVTVRRAEEAGPTALELLLEGALPAACLALHEAKQTRSGHLVHVTLQMRKPRNAWCPAMVRPFRFYLSLNGRFVPGSYTLFVNGEAYPVTVRERS